ncbi:MAG: hypothetical protein HN356_11405 [Calditrichaeota bacterium]|nr:hypothetical protein [Calditrichota bacterium]MBT7789555.1 hypothetical protein [Calditrichota bacterium]
MKILKTNPELDYRRQDDIHTLPIGFLDENRRSANLAFPCAIFSFTTEINCSDKCKRSAFCTSLLISQTDGGD